MWPLVHKQDLFWEIKSFIGYQRNRLKDSDTDYDNDEPCLDFGQSSFHKNNRG